MCVCACVHARACGRACLRVTYLITVKDDVTVDRPNRSGGHVASLSSNWRGTGQLSPLPGVVSQSTGHALKS